MKRSKPNPRVVAPTKPGLANRTHGKRSGAEGKDGWSLDAIFEAELQSKLRSVYGLLKAESDRGCVIVLAAVVEEGLEQIILARLVPSAEANDELLANPYAPLGTLSAKIDFAYRIGVIDSSMRSSLHLLRRIRNDLAHSSFKLGFDGQGVQGRIREMLKLNRALVSVMWTRVEAMNDKRVTQALHGMRAKDSLAKLVELLGWRRSLELVGSAIAVWLHCASDAAVQIEPLRQGNWG